MNTAKTVALIVLIINALYFIYTLYVIFTVGYDEILEKWDEIMLEIKNNS